MRAEDIDDIFDGRWVTKYEYLVSCPICGDSTSHPHMHLNPTKGVYYCFHCGAKGHLKQLVDDYAHGARYKKSVSKKVDQAVDKIDFYDFSRIIAMVPDALNTKAMDYLHERGMSDEEIVTYQVRLARYGKFAWRVVFPMVEERKVVCFAGRKMPGVDGTKWRFPRRDETISTASETVYNINSVEDHHTVVITEGIFDAINIERLSRGGICGVALNGKRLHQPQLYKLLKLPKVETFCVMLDSDAKMETLTAAKQLSVYGKKVKICLLGSGEPEDIISEDELAFRVENAQYLDIYTEVKGILG